MIRAVSIRNYKNIKDQRIELDRLTVFVGANGSGKTSVLEAIERVVHANTNRSSVKRDQLDWIYTRGASADLSIDCETASGRFIINMSPPNPRLDLSVPSQAERAHEWTLHYTGEDFELSGQRSIALYDERSFRKVRSSVLPLFYSRLDATRLAKASYSEDSQPRIQRDGSGAASVLAFMALNDPDSFDELMNHVRDLLPRIKRIRFRKVPVQRNETESITIGGDSGQRQTSRIFQGEAMLFDYENARDVAAHTVSEGTLMIVGLLTVLLGPDRPKTLLLDDIEHGLHPLAQKQLITVIGQIMERFPDLQILATAHSPYLLNYLSPEQVRIMATDSEGHALCGQLTDHPKFATWKDEMAPGELWSLFGEKWLTGAEAAK